MIRSDGTSLKVSADWYSNVVAGLAPSTGQSGNFLLGAGASPAQTASPVSVRYMNFFSRCLNDADTRRMQRWMERQKNGEYPAATLFYATGQSNYQTTEEPVRRELSSGFANAEMAFARAYPGRPLNSWMKDKDDGSGYEICPTYDLSKAPASSLAASQVGLHSGAQIFTDWKIRTDALANNPKTQSICVFVQGESDARSDARTTWKFNDSGNYNLAYPMADSLARTYGPRAAAWNASIRQQTGTPGMYFIYERVAFASPVVLDAATTAQVHLQQKTLLDAVKEDPRWFFVDTEAFPRDDGIHMTTLDSAPGDIPNTGTERFARALGRLAKNVEALSNLPVDARLLAMRAIDSGMEMNAAQMKACVTFAATPGFSNLRSLVIPTLKATSPIDQAALRRCNLLLHLGGIDPAGFLPVVPANCTATCVAGANVVRLKLAIRALLNAWGMTGTVTLTGISES